MARDDRQDPDTGTMAATRADGWRTPEHLLETMRRVFREHGPLPPIQSSLKPLSLSALSPPYAEQRERVWLYGPRQPPRTILSMDMGTTPDRTAFVVVRRRTHEEDAPGQIKDSQRWHFLNMPPRQRETKAPSVKGWRSRVLGALVFALLLGRRG